MSCRLPVPVVILVSMQYHIDFLHAVLWCGKEHMCFVLLFVCLFFLFFFASFEFLQTKHLSFSAVVPIVPVVIPLAINPEFMVTFSQPNLINEIGNITEQQLRL